MDNQMYWMDTVPTSNLGPELFGPLGIGAATPSASIVPAAPSVLAKAAVGSNQVDLTWVDNANNESGFLLQRAIDAGFTSAVTTFALSGRRCFTSKLSS